MEERDSHLNLCLYDKLPRTVLSKKKKKGVKTIYETQTMFYIWQRMQNTFSTAVLNNPNNKLIKTLRFKAD